MRAEPFPKPLRKGPWPHCPGQSTGRRPGPNQWAWVRLLFLYQKVLYGLGKEPYYFLWLNYLIDETSKFCLKGLYILNKMYANIWSRDWYAVSAEKWSILLFSCCSMATLSVKDNGEK